MPRQKATPQQRRGARQDVQQTASPDGQGQTAQQNAALDTEDHVRLELPEAQPATLPTEKEQPAEEERPVKRRRKDAIGPKKTIIHELLPTYSVLSFLELPVATRASDTPTTLIAQQLSSSLSLSLCQEHESHLQCSNGIAQVSLRHLR